MTRDTVKKRPKKPIKVLRVRKVLHVGIDLATAPWVGTLIRAMPGNVENHGPRTDDPTASYLQLYRPEFPELKPQAGPGPMNRMARVMRGYDLTVSHGDAAFPATMGHTLFGQALKLPPLVHYHYGVDEVPAGWWARFRHRLGLARTPLVVAPTAAAARSVVNDWQVPRARMHILPPVFPAPKAKPKPDAIPRVLKRAGEKWIGMRAADALALTDALLPALADLDDCWHLVVFGAKEMTDKLSKAMDGQDFVHRLHVTAKLNGPGAVAGLFDIAILDGRDGLIPAEMPSLMAAGVPLLTIAPNGLNDLLPRDTRDFRLDPADVARLGERLLLLAQDDATRAAAGKANAEFAAQHADPAPHLKLLAQALDLGSLADR